MRNLSRLVFLSLLVCSVSVQGQQQDLDRGLEATVNSEFSYDDNILRQKTDGIGSRIWVFNPRIGYAFQSAGTDASIFYDFSNSKYLDSSADSYSSHTLNLSLDKQLNRSNKIMVQSSVLSSAEARGVGFNEGGNAALLDAPTDLDTQSVVANYQLGAEDARMRMVASIGKRSTDRNSPIIINDSRDFDEALDGAQIMYRLGWRTDLVTEYRRRKVIYSRTPIAADGTKQSLDSTESQSLVGFDLKATAKTTGKLRVGTTKRDFKWEAAQWEDGPVTSQVEEPAPALAQPRLGTDSDLYWELTAIWAPRSYSTFTLNSRVSTREALAVGNFIRSQDYSLLWSHRLNSQIQAELDVSTGTDTYVGSSRIDDRRAISVRMLYTFEEWLNLGLGIRHQTLDSTFENAGFDKLVYYMYFTYKDQWGN